MCVKPSSSLLHDAELTEIGSCEAGGCNALETGAAPFACYSFRKFRIWADAPHVLLLDYLIEEQNRLQDQGHSAEAETLTQPIIAISDLLEAIRIREAQVYG
ncbi:hypothetical protein SAMN04488518_112130 [Pseudovibrio ascidiaceicola]|uniref:Uncharacterized protein n=1 Tax=Pseudovibrio ascidiaceicola TaxID=285279 RepID=A0A1I4DUK9_9HYPH|nr:hypothetical protein [Pseudovibrio ascidiaceicola]SFK95746.1 hypothetical protein SAMN04488518_112130 [Pseudovibrio ascidiaceicola]